MSEDMIENPDELENTEEVRNALLREKLELPDAVYQKLWDHLNRWATVVSLADQAVRYGGDDPEEFVDDLITKWHQEAGRLLEEDLQNRIQLLGLREAYVEEQRTKNKQELQEVTNQVLFSVKNALKKRS
jgi:hypothetical protein